MNAFSVHCGQDARAPGIMKKRKFKVGIAFVCLGGIIFGWQYVEKKSLASGEKVQTEKTYERQKIKKEIAVENALYTRTEFFGAEATVPFPTEKARQNLAEVSEKFPDDAEIYQKLSQLDEKLERFDLAEAELNKYVELQKDGLNAQENLVAFYERRAEFAKKAETLEKMLALASEEKRALIFSRLIGFARIHELEKYLKPEFYQQIAAQNPSVFPIIEQLIDKLTEEKNYAEALKILREYKDKFPERQKILLEKEVAILLVTENPKEAEKVYQAAFDPFWSDETTEKFYGFLKDQDRFRAYGNELKTSFKREPIDFDTALRLIHFRQHDGTYDNDSSATVILQLEKARSEAKIVWKPEELVAAARVLLADGESDLASRFLYTLHLQNALEPKSQLRAKVLYQLFELLSDSGENRITLTKGDLRFYEDVGKSDPHPGITSGILSLIFSDTEPQRELAAKERTATKFFNRAAAYRIFQAYKEEYPTSPELAQMYLDIVRLSAAGKETEIAEKTLAEFEQRDEKSSDYANVALKLADAFVATNQPQKERAVYQRILDYLGKQGKPLAPIVENYEFRVDSDNSTPAPTEDKQTPPISNRGINIPGENKKVDDYYYDNQNPLRDYPATKTDEITYSKVLERFVSSLVKDKLTNEILVLYSGEIGKYPDEQWLYEQRLNWLEQTNLVNEQLKVYQTAIKQFQTRNWEDRLARWFLQRGKKQEFAKFSQDLLEKLDDAEAQNYLLQFVDTRMSASEFDEQLYLKLYTTAHGRFPHNISFVNGLLNFYKAHKQGNDWRKLSAAYYFESKQVRELFIKDLAEKRELRNFLNTAREKCCVEAISQENLPYALFRADAAAHLANFEEAVDAYRRLNELYPHTPEFQERLLNFTRSFGQRNRRSLAEAANVAHAQAEFSPFSAEFRTRSGELQAELGNYENARNEWEKLIITAQGEPDIYLETATVYWDYFQYDDALRTIKTLREKMNDDTLYAFQTGAILEAQHKMPEAIGEYVKALDAAEDEEYSQTNRAKQRLVKIAGQKAENLQAINSAFVTERKNRKDGSKLILAYAEFLQDLGKLTTDEHRYTQIGEQGSQFQISNSKSRILNPCSSVSICGFNVLKQEISRSENKDFLDSAREFFAANDNKNGEQIALRRLAQTATSSRNAISYRLQLADSFLEENRRDEAKSVVSELLAKFPTNYGVLSESADIYWQMNARDDAIRVLQAGASRGKGKFQYLFSRKLAAKLVLQNRLDEAERILANLHNEDESDTEVFRELTNIYVNQAKPDALKKVFGETLEALKNQDIERRELNETVARFRTQMIDAFTRLKDFSSAVEQHIEIINREPDNEENVEKAIYYVKRYGDGDVLLSYYQKTADEAYKNYRWNVVLARIFEANNDLENAVRNYKSAIGNQPEMTELYVALADIETRRKNYDAALENINKVLELTNDEPQFIKLKIEVLEKAGRTKEAKAESEKLPVEERPKQTISDRFAEARNLQNVEKAKAIETYRQAFNELLENPFAHDLKAADVSGYAATLRTEENLDAITERLWNLREKFVVEADGNNSINAGKARNQLQVLDGAMPEAIGNIAKTTATSDENTALQKDLSRRIDEVLKETDRYSTLSLLQNIAHRSGFGALEEKVLIAQKDAAFASDSAENYHIRLRVLIDFYSERGMFQKVLDVLETERGRDKNAASFDYPRLIADNARLVGNTEKELAVLRENYRKASGKLVAEPNEMAARYLEFLYENKREELAILARQSSPYQLQLINFLLAKGKRDWAHEAMENASLPTSWKLARNAETSLALREYADKNECYFCAALRLAPIGEFIKQRPDKSNQLVGDDWFRLVGGYGEWLYFAPSDEMRRDAKNFLPAMIENRPHDADEQAKLGAFYLEQTDAKNALEHLWLALEMKPDDKKTRANLGAVYFQMSDEKKAREIWTEIIAGENPTLEDGELYLQTLNKYDLQTEARENLFPIVIKKLKENDDGSDNYYGNDKQELPENLKNLIRQVSASFDAETTKTAYFQKLVSAVPKSVLLPELLINESLIAENNRAPFYEILIARSKTSSSSDYDYEAVLQRTYSTDEAEEVLDRENDYKISEPESGRIGWQKEYLGFLLKTDENAKAQTLIYLIESELNRRYARPEWLRLAKLKLQIREGNSARTLSDAKRFVGIEIKFAVQSVKPPGIERLNAVLQILRDEKLEAEAKDLLQAFYARQLVLEQFETANFVGLARIFFEKNDAENALKLLQIMIDASDEDKKPTVLAELASLPQIKLFAVDGAKPKETETVVSINQNEALKLAAEAASDFKQTEKSIAFRQRLLEIAPEDAANRLELARLFARNENQAEAVKLLASIINDRNSGRDSRWQAVWLSTEIIKNKADLLNETESAESELRNALEIFANNQIEIKVENPGSQFWFFVGLAARSFRQNEFAINAFNNSLIADKDAENPFAAESAPQQLIRLYITTGQPNAAVRLADLDKGAKSDELLDLLSETAEKIGDFPRTMAFEKAKSKEIDGERIKHLQNLEKEKTRKVTDFTVDLQNTSSFDFER
ncbi:MAG: tetratricopeptide repeat protein [Pyrinomonadaceae bacterium]